MISEFNQRKTRAKWTTFQFILIEILIILISVSLRLVKRLYFLQFAESRLDLGENRISSNWFTELIDHDFNQPFWLIRFHWYDGVGRYLPKYHISHKIMTEVSLWLHWWVELMSIYNFYVGLIFEYEVNFY